jgi:hypothetical protein
MQRSPLQAPQFRKRNLPLTNIPAAGRFLQTTQRGVACFFFFSAFGISSPCQSQKFKASEEASGAVPARKKIVIIRCVGSQPDACSDRRLRLCSYGLPTAKILIFLLFGKSA